MGAYSCGALRSRVPAFLDFSFAFRVPAFLLRHFFHIPLCSRIPVSRSYAPLSKSVCVGGGGVTHHMRTVCVTLCMDGSGKLGQLATSPSPPLVTHGRCTSILVGSRFGVKFISCPQSPPSTSPLSTRHNCVISSQERIFIVPILSRSALPRSCIKCAFPRAPVPKIPGPRECGNAKPGTSAHLCQGV